MKKLTLQEVILRFVKTHGLKYDYSKFIYLGMQHKGIIICKIHGEFLQAAGHHISGNECNKCYGGVAHDKTEFVILANIKHNNRYDYSKFIYINSQTKGTITCKVHGDFLQRPSKHLYGDGCKKCATELWATERIKPVMLFINEANLVHNFKYDYSKFIYIKSNIKGIIICPMHGEFLQDPSHHLQGNGCLQCNIYKLSNRDEFIKKSNISHDNIYDYSKFIYINSQTEGIITCKVHGDFLQRPAYHVAGHGCKQCKSEKLRQLFANTYEMFVEASNIVHNNRYDYSKFIYINSRTKGIIICLIHGDFEKTPQHHIGDKSGCSKCYHTISHSEIEWLDYLKIPENKRQIIIIVNGIRYKIDGQDEYNSKILYEFNGDYWHGNPKIYNHTDINPVTKTTFGELYLKTLKKQSTLEGAGYTVISVWESDWLEQKKNNK